MLYIPNTTLIIRDRISGMEQHIPLPHIERKVCQNSLIHSLIADKKAEKKKHR